MGKVKTSASMSRFRKFKIFTIVYVYEVLIKTYKFKL